MKKNSIFRRDFIKKSVIGAISAFFVTRLSASPKQENFLSTSFPLGGEFPFLGEIQIIAFDFVPRYWALCNGQLLPINQNQALFSLLGTTYGGNGQTTFALPDFRDRMPIHFGNGHTQGEISGSSTITLAANQIPPLTFPTQKVLIRDATGTQGKGVVDGGANGNSTAVITRAGSGTAHTNMPPYLTLNFVIALQGIFPSPN